MRIISGRFKGKSIDMPKGIRPTSDKVREALFEIFKGRIEGASFLDLYSGSGAVGIEAFSRGARSVAFADSSLKCITVLKKNLTRLGIWRLSSIHIYKGKALGVLAKGELAGPFDIVFMDPPYNKGMLKNTLIALSNRDILTRNAVVVIEAFKKEDLPEKAGSLSRFRVARYGDTKLEFFRK